MNRSGFPCAVPTVPLPEIVHYMDTLLRVRELPDYPDAHNGLQLENGGMVGAIAAAVDAGKFTIERAAEQGISLLLVHHGLFWGGAQPLVGGRYSTWKRAFAAGVAIYSAHLPLDVHPELGNNALLCKALGLSQTEAFLPFKELPLGLRTTVSMERDELMRRFQAAVGGEVKLCPGGPPITREIGVVTGGAGGELRAVAAAGIDTFVTGEGPHWSFPLAEELGVNVLYGGHYATETFGVRALAENVAAKFKLDWHFIDHPSGL